MKFDTEICKGVSCHECSFNKGEGGCLLAKRLDEIEIIPEPCEDALKKIGNILKDAIGITLHVTKISKHCSDFSDLDEVPECEDADKLKRCRFEYINACKTVTYPTPDTSKNDIYDAYAVIKALHPIFGDEEF